MSRQAGGQTEVASSWGADSRRCPVAGYPSGHASRWRKEVREGKIVTKRGIPFRTVVEGGREYIIWEEIHAERVRAWEEFPSYYGN